MIKIALMALLYVFFISLASTKAAPDQAAGDPTQNERMN